MSIHTRFKTYITGAATIVLATLFTVGVVVAATTIGANIYSTGGALFNQASTTAFQVENGSGTDVLKVDTTNSGIVMTGAATTTLYHWLGTGGTANFVDYTGGDLYVQDDAEIDDKLFVTGNLTLAADVYSSDGVLLNVASTTALEVQNGSGTSVLKVDTSNLGVKVTGAATSTIYLWVGSAGTANNLGYTGGELYVQDDVEIDGIAYMNRATSTSATSTAYLYVGPDFTESGTFNFSGGDLAVADEATIAGIVTLSSNAYSRGGALFDKASTTAFQLQNGSGTQVLNVDTSNLGVKVTGAATSTIYLWVGAAGTANNLGYTGGELYVQDDVEIDGIAYMNRATSTSATSTAYLYVGPDFTEPAGFDFQGGDLGVANDAAIGGNATTTGNFTVGDAQSGATSTIEIGDANTAGCLKIRDADANAWSYCYIEDGTLTCSASDNCLK